MAARGSQHTDRKTAWASTVLLIKVYWMVNLSTILQSINLFFYCMIFVQCDLIPEVTVRDNCTLRVDSRWPTRLEIQILQKNGSVGIASDTCRSVRSHYNISILYFTGTLIFPDFLIAKIQVTNVNINFIFWNKIRQFFVIFFSLSNNHCNWVAFLRLMFLRFNQRKTTFRKASVNSQAE